VSKTKQRLRAAMRRRTGEPEERRVSIPLNILGPDAPCPICLMLDEIIIHRLPAWADQDCAPYSEKPEAWDLGLLFDQTPDATRSDLPCKP